MTLEEAQIMLDAWLHILGTWKTNRDQATLNHGFDASLLEVRNGLSPERNSGTLRELRKMPGRFEGLPELRQLRAAIGVSMPGPPSRPGGGKRFGQLLRVF